MEISEKKEPFNKGLCIFFSIIAIVSFTTVLSTPSTGGCMSIIDEKDSISNLSFNHDGRKVVFDRCHAGSCQIQVYDLETGELAAYQSPKGERWTMGKYAYDGKKITFSVIPINSKGILDLGEMQIAIMDADGENYRKVTTGQGAKLYPTFSHSGKKILYARAAHIRTQGRTPAGQYDAWEVNLETGEQIQLTFFEYFYMGNLTYFPDDERFLYYGDRPGVYEGMRSYPYEEAFRVKMGELERQGKRIAGVVVMKGQGLIVNPYQFPPQTFPGKPLLSKDGSVMIYLKSHSGKFYLYSEEGKHRLVGEGGPVSAAAISPDGELLGMIAVSLTIDIYATRDGNALWCLYLPCAPKKITNWSIPPKYKNIYKMIPEKASRVINCNE